MANPGLTDEQCQQAVDAVAAHGSKSAAARALGIPAATFNTRWRTATCRDFKAEVQPIIGGEAHAIPEGYKLKGTSTLIDRNGNAKLQWVKTDASLEKLREMQEAAFRALTAELKPLPKISGPRSVSADLATLYTLTDCHVGMLAWDKETGADWDLKIAEECLTQTLIRMIDSAPSSGTGIVNQLGDFLHFDSLQPLTPTSKHVLDADSRFQKMVEVSVRILRRIIEHALTKHRHVQVFMHEGNHDPAGSVWLRVMFAQLYARNSRVAVGMSPNPYVAYQHGKTLLGFHHGHLRNTKGGALPLLFAAQYPKEWGETEYRYIHTGHMHHVEEKEHPGIKVVQHPTLAAPDAYAARGGWLSKRQATSMTYSKEFGECARGIFVP